MPLVSTAKDCDRLWQYYKDEIEDIFLQTKRHVCINRINFSTFSDGYISLLNTIGSEADNLMKELSGLDRNDGKQYNMKQYRKKINENFPRIETEKVYLQMSAIGYSNYKIVLYPFKDFKTRFKNSKGKLQFKGMRWWKAYNNVKHNRNQYASQANLKNVLTAISALYLMNKLLQRRLSVSVQPESRLFSLSDTTNI